jgi:hypothetical protein
MGNSKQKFRLMGVSFAGVITSACTATSRQIQLALKLIFLKVIFWKTALGFFQTVQRGATYGLDGERCESKAI